MTIELPALPYAPDALAPHISEQTISFHYGKHHAAYVANLKKLIDGTDLATLPLEQIILKADGGTFNNAAQIWNHTFYWNSMSPGGGGKPGTAVSSALEASFGSVDTFLEQFAAAAKAAFGSGWTWLVKDGDALKITTTANADLPMKHGQTALLTIDVWEHAYYLDYQNLRPSYVDAYVQHLLNWEFVETNLKG